MTEMFLTPNKYSRPCTSLTTIQRLVVHWVGNAGSTAENNAKYFEGLKVGKRNSVGEYIYASSHYIIGNDGVLVQCVPENEIAYHASKANSHSLGFEVCHPDWTGKFTGAAYKTLIETLAQCCIKYRLNPMTDIIRHYDVTGKDCPKYYVQNKSEWDKLKLDVQSLMTKDTDLEKAVERLMVKGIIGSPDSWLSLTAINLKNVPHLITKFGKIMFNIADYDQVILEMVHQKIINSPDLWTTKQYKKEHVKALIIKMGAFVT